MFDPANMKTVEYLALSQKETRRLTVAKCMTYKHIFDLNQQDYQVWSATKVHVGLLRAPTTFEGAIGNNFSLSEFLVN